MKKVLFILLSLYIIILSNNNVQASSITCEYTMDNNGMSIILKKYDVNDVGWSISGNKSNYVYMISTTSNLLNTNTCSGQIQYACMNGTCYIAQVGESINIASTLKGTLTLKKTSSSSTSNGKSLLDNSWANNISTDACPTIFGSPSDPNSIFGILHTYVFTPIRWLVPIALLVLTTLDFAKVVFTDDKDGMKKAQNHFVKRAIVAVIIFFAPNIVSILLSLIDGLSVTSCLDTTSISGL